MMASWEYKFQPRQSRVQNWYSQVYIIMPNVSIVEKGLIKWYLNIIYPKFTLKIWSLPSKVEYVQKSVLLYFVGTNF